MPSTVINAYHRTETVLDGFVARVEIVGIIDPLRDDVYVFPTKEEARAREVQLAEKWKLAHGPFDRP